MLTQHCLHEPLNLYEINTRVWLHELGVPSLRAVPDYVLDEIAALGFRLVWLMGVWAPSAAAQAAARAHPLLRAEVSAVWPELHDEDIVASPYAIPRYALSPLLGAEDDLADLRRRLHQRDIGLILDFVPNHTAYDHPWLSAHPEYYVTDSTGAAASDAIFTTRGGVRVYHGRDPYFPPWSDTAQLDYRRRDTRQAVLGELGAVADRADGLRCDMAMLLLQDVFARTWGPGGDAQGEFWAEAIDAVRAAHPGFLFIAEAYWGLERRLQQLGFDYTYDKELYDALGRGDAGSVRRHLSEGRGRQRRALRFVENHDEERAASRFGSGERHRVAALLTLTLPGVRLIYQGQMTGATVRLPVQLRRAPPELDHGVAEFYRRLLLALADPVLRLGRWQLARLREAWSGNPSHEAVVVYGWDGSLLHGNGDGGHRLLAANLAPHRAQCRVPLPLPGLAGRTVVLTELLGTGASPSGDDRTPAGAPIYLRDGDELAAQGLFLDLPAHSAQLLSLHPRSR